MGKKGEKTENGGRRAVERDYRLQIPKAQVSNLRFQILGDSPRSCASGTGWWRVMGFLAEISVEAGQKCTAYL